MATTAPRGTAGDASPDAPNAGNSTAAAAAAAAADDPIVAAADTAADAAGDTGLAELPLELLCGHVLPRLPPGERLRLRAVSRDWAACVEGLAPHVNLVLPPIGPARRWGQRPRWSGCFMQAAKGPKSWRRSCGGGSRDNSDGGCGAGDSGEGGGGGVNSPSEDGAGGKAGAARGQGGERSVGNATIAAAASADDGNGVTGPGDGGDGDSGSLLEADAVRSGSGSSGVGQCDGGQLAHRFPAALGLRLWLGCEPPAPLGASDWLPGDGSGDDDGDNSDSKRGEQATAPTAAADGGSGDGSRRGAPCATLTSALAVAAAVATAAVVVGRDGGAALTAALAAAAAAWIAIPLSLLMLAAVAVAVAKCRPRRRPAAVQGSACPRPPVWSARHSDSLADLHFAPGYGPRRGWPPQRDPEPQPQPQLPAWLPVVGRSARLRALGLVTSSDLEPQDLLALSAAFPGLRALALHAHRPPGLERCTARPPAPIRLRSLAPLLLPPPQPSAGAAPIGAPAAGSAAGTPAMMPGPGPVRAPVQPPLLGPQLRSLVLSGVRCEAEGDGGSGGGDRDSSFGLAGLSGLHSLVLHRVRARWHRLTPELEALTRLTRLELLDSDFHDASVLSAADRAEAEARAKARWARDNMWHAAWRERERRRREARAAARGTAGGPEGWADRGHASCEGEEEEDEEDEEDGDGEEDAEEAGPWVVPMGWRRELVPQWEVTMTGLGRVVAALRALRVLSCDVACPPDMPWRAPALQPFLKALARCIHLESLSLPGCQLGSAAQARWLAAALPRLTSLELGSLPPALGRRRQAARTPGMSWDEHQMQLRAAQAALRAAEQAKLAELRLRYACRSACAAAAAGGGGGEAAAAVSAAAAFAARAGEGDGGGSRSLGGAVPDAATSSDGGLTNEFVSSERGGSGGGGCLGGFTALRRLTLRRATVAQLAQHAVPLPPRLAELVAPLRHSFDTSPVAPGDSEHLMLAPSDLLVLHARLLPALRPVGGLALTPVGPCPHADAPLLRAMLGAWMGERLLELDLGPATHPEYVGAADLLGCLSCLFPPQAAQQQQQQLSTSQSAGVQAAPAALPHMLGATAERLRAPLIRGGRATPDPSSSDGVSYAGGIPWPLVECLNRMACLERLEVQVIAVAAWAVPPLARLLAQPRAYCPHRVPLGLLAALARPLRVVDCSPLNAWCSPDNSTDPRVALSQARAALAAAGCRAALVAEAEERAASAMGLGHRLAAVWREEALSQAWGHDAAQAVYTAPLTAPLQQQQHAEATDRKPRS
ncbi:hypothetical protein GPECTOR_47g323 [Gonium pectorale]|uniref:F-box domain-containing protein n=1 Tax=Gonium pectorale TaxID=33097 RepID=A0A150G8A2_GONPE|nr:hypothetical protein GPECTOR_47g323 [Gonium pectorale]|eukprot:KXZ46048.1 hypothetical protein GPECTOR_47g323 [Gonium pectorale]